MHLERAEDLELHVVSCLGNYARGQASAAQPDWYTALMARSEALNRMYGLGQYAKTTP